jgi:hypothetical protein
MEDEDKDKMKLGDAMALGFFIPFGLGILGTFVRIPRAGAIGFGVGAFVSIIIIFIFGMLFKWFKF